MALVIGYGYKWYVSSYNIVEGKIIGLHYVKYICLLPVNNANGIDDNAYSIDLLVSNTYSIDCVPTV